MALSSRIPPESRSNGFASRNQPRSAIEDVFSDALDQSQSAEGDAAKKAKRRSLLPQFTRKVSAEDSPRKVPIEEVDAVRDDGDDCHKRPMLRDEERATDYGRRTAIDADRRIMPPPAKRSSRPASIAPPRDPSQSGRAQPRSMTQTHSSTGENPMGVEGARADSLAALTGAARTEKSRASGLEGGGLKRAGSTRLPQSPKKQGAPSIPSRTTSKRTAESSGRPMAASTETRLGSAHSRRIGAVAETPSTTEKRSSIAQPRPRSIIASTNVQNVLQTSPPRNTSTSSLGPHVQAPKLGQHKPNFSNFQQHYSPAKSSLPKAPLIHPKTTRPTSSSLDVDAGVPPDVATQQLELLQLSLLHEASVQTARDYTASAKRKLGRRHARLRKEYESIRATELVNQRAANLSALETWCADPALLVENLQILSLVHSDLEALLSAGSRHAEVIDGFERWIDRGNDEFERADFVQPLPDDWRHAHSSLNLKLRSIQRNLGVLPPPASTSMPAETGLEIVLRDCKALLGGMLKELEVMSKLEAEVLTREKTRVNREVKMLLMNDVMIGKDSWKPAWQSVE